MLDNLTQRLSSVVKTLRGHSRITEDNVQDMVREVRLALLDADAGLPVVKDFVGRVKEKALGQEVAGSLTPGQAHLAHHVLDVLLGEARVAAEGLDDGGQAFGQGVEHGGIGKLAGSIENRHRNA